MPRKKTAKGKLKCAKCGKSFALPMHLGRHMTTQHGQAAGKKNAGRPRKAKAAAASGGLQLDFRNMPADDLIAVLTGAREEANRRLAGLREAVE